MNLKEKLERAKLLAQSKWVRIGLALQIPALLMLAFFWQGGKAFIALILSDEFGFLAHTFGPGVAFKVAYKSILFFAMGGGICILIGCVRIVTGQIKTSYRAGSGVTSRQATNQLPDE